MYPNYSVGVNYGLPVPYQSVISPALSNGTQIRLTGTATGSRFEVNLKSYQEDTILHVNPRLDDNALVLNSAQRGFWGQEERHGLPIYRGMRFSIVILATDHDFKIAINNTHVCEFYQRLPMYLAQLVEVKGDLNLESVHINPGSGYIGSGTGLCSQPQPSYSGDFVASCGLPSAPPNILPPPFTGSGVPSIQSCRIHTGSRIFIRGFIPPEAHRFELNLLHGYSDGDDIAFHFNPRFDSRTVVKNYRRNGQWGQEENQSFPSYMPLMPGSSVDLQIACNMDAYTVYMNNYLIGEFYHKIPPGHVMALQYKGDIIVGSIGQL
ncbi:unnamed protein product [Rotaria socialis]|uniref:Galectin n=1 Tax=Rotaria socialis TaxID=392032 RepID=A0A817WNK1_9BILA|nr:unnamed protein product [Rotaria socialis]CAF3710864.1 unnamed protein product [Rotaria socialis]CAF4251402.1 unnamed protein product [Rotaria socialis]CAF4491701.1 unnamed protein product [Rotaria socialis]CAF4561695.1 unnamed protein product [Rotaria socialis]